MIKINKKNQKKIKEELQNRQVAIELDEAKCKEVIILYHLFIELTAGLNISKIT
jgi:hypothetical protein